MSLLPVAILAGGLATRLGPVARQTPKCLLDVAGRPFVHHQLRQLHDQGVRRVVLCLGHLGEQVMETVGDGSAFGLEVVYSFDGPELRGTAGAIKRVEAELRRARRARSRRLYAFWSAVLAQIDPDRNECSFRGERTGRSPLGPRRGRQSHEGQARLSDDRLSPAPAGGAARPVISGQALETPAPNTLRTAVRRA